VTGQGGDGPAELTPEARERVLAKVAERKRRNEERCAELGIDTSPEGVAASLRQAERERQARAAERAGRLDFGMVSDR
jgi:hypothetical protein